MSKLQVFLNKYSNKKHDDIVLTLITFYIVAYGLLFTGVLGRIIYTVFTVFNFYKGAIVWIINLF